MHCLNCRRNNTIAYREPLPARADRAGAQSLASIESETVARIGSGFSSLDAVLGGGFARGGSFVLAGAPGSGKSTLLLQACARMNVPVLYLCGEEAPSRLSERALRLKLDPAGIQICRYTELAAFARVARKLRPRFVIVDSLNVTYTERLRSRLGAPSQLIACAQGFTALANSLDCALVLIGHVTRKNFLAAPRNVEHAVDVMGHFQVMPDQSRKFFLTKNRFGPTHIIGTLRMTETGLVDG